MSPRESFSHNFFRACNKFYKLKLTFRRKNAKFNWAFIFDPSFFWWWWSDPFGNLFKGNSLSLLHRHRQKSRNPNVGLSCTLLNIYEGQLSLGGFASMAQVAQAPGRGRCDPGAWCWSPSLRPAPPPRPRSPCLGCHRWMCRTCTTRWNIYFKVANKKLQRVNKKLCCILTSLTCSCTSRGIWRHCGCQSPQTGSVYSGPNASQRPVKYKLQRCSKMIKYELLKYISFQRCYDCQ